MELHSLKPPSGAVKKRKRVGRGQGCHGKTSGRGHKGQKSRSGYSRKIGFEGGQMPLHRRVPKRGFTNIFAKKPAAINLMQLAQYKDIDEFTPEVMIERKIVKKAEHGIKILAKGEIDRPIKVKVHQISDAAKTKIEKAGGTVEVIS
jgi:large subunit ribosomal protein L15